MLKPDAEPASLDVQHQRPLKTVITVSAHNQNLRTNGAQFVENVFRAYIAEMPNFVSLAGKPAYIFR